MVFLDPDDELVGSGLSEALQLAKSTNADIVQFGCRMVFFHSKNSVKCWLEPKRGSTANRTRLIHMWFHRRVDGDLHRKVWKTALFQRAVRSMPADLKEMRILRMEDALLYVYVLLNMNGMYDYISTVGEIRHFGWPDSSQTEAYQSYNATSSQMNFVSKWIAKLFAQRK
jgi:hypothetical protein